MPKKLAYELDDEQLKTIEQAIRTEKDTRVVRRATGIRLLHLGHSPEEVVEILMVSSASVYRWHRLWKAEGLDGLRDKPRPGRPRIADEEYCQLLEEALESEPAAYGYEFAIWTVERLREHLERKTEKSLSAGRLRIVMQELEYVYRRPTEDLGHVQDKDAHDQVEELIEALKRGPNEAILSSSLWTKRP